MPRRPLRVALIGGGAMAAVHSHAWALLARDEHLPLEVRLAAISTRSDTGRAVARRFDWVTVDDDWRRAATDDDIDLVDICVPSHLHEDIALIALEHGKHVLCEKPLTLGVDGARRLAHRAAARHAHRLVTMVGHNYRRIPAIDSSRQMVERGLLGDLLHVRASYLQDWAIDPDLPSTWRMRIEHAGRGVVGDLGSHLVDMIHHLTDQAIVVDASRASIHIRRRPGPGGGLVDVTTDDTATAIGHLDGGADVSIEVSRIAAGHHNDMDLEISGTGGAIRFSLTAPHQLAHHLRSSPGWTTRSGPDLPDPWQRGRPSRVTFDLRTTYEYQARDLVRAIVDDHDAAPSFADGLRVQATLDQFEHVADPGP